MIDHACPMCQSTNVIPAGIRQRSRKRYRCLRCHYENLETWFWDGGTLRAKMERVWKERPLQTAQRRARWA